MTISVAERSESFVYDLCVFRLARSRGDKARSFISGLSRHDDLLVTVQNICGFAVCFNTSCVEENGARTESADRVRVMRDEENSRAPFLHLFNPAQAALLKDSVADRKRFVNNQDLRVCTDGDGEGQAYVHAARIGLDGLQDEIANLREAFYLRQSRVNLASGKSHQSG